MANEKTVISISKPTPSWCTWVFRVVFLLTTAASIWVAGTGRINDKDKVELMLAFKSLDVVVWGIGRGLGVQKEQFDTDNP